jgi:hypothetical protein
MNYMRKKVYKIAKNRFFNNILEINPDTKGEVITNTSCRKSDIYNFFEFDEIYRLVREMTLFDEIFFDKFFTSKGTVHIKFSLYFHYKGGPLPKKSRKFFLVQI